VDLHSTVTAGREPPKARRAARSNDPWRSISTNTARGRRVVDLARQYLGQAPEIDVDEAIATAELIEAAEHARAEARRPGASIAEADAAARITASAERRRLRLLDRKEEPSIVPLRDRLGGAA
jgi:hypothetical protein